MASSYTPRLLLPEMADGEQSGYVTYNELARILDANLQAVVQSRMLATPPGSPADGQCWYVPTGATGAWAGNEQTIAQWFNGQWWFYPGAAKAMWVLDEEIYWIGEQPGIGAVMALAGSPVAQSITTTFQTFLIADSSVVATNSPAPSTVDLANSRITLNDHDNDAALQVNMQASIIGSGNNVQYIGAIFKNGVAETHLRSSFTATNQSPNAQLVIPGGITYGKSGDFFDVRFAVDTGTQGASFEAFSLSILPIA